MLIPIIGLASATVYALLAKRLKVTSYAKKFIGVPYAWGGTTPEGFDCSGFVKYVYANANTALPRTANEQYKFAEPINKDTIRSGDLVFFKDNLNNPVKHVGIVLNQNEFIHASTSQGVTITPLNNPYWKPRIFAFGRV